MRSQLQVRDLEELSAAVQMPAGARIVAYLEAERDAEVEQLMAYAAHGVDTTILAGARRAAVLNEILVFLTTGVREDLTRARGQAADR